jgi:HEPN domain-containing protein
MADDLALRRQELARLMLQKARQDLEATRSLSRAANVADEIAGFHVQQAIEKALKAVLTRLGLEYEYTHDLSVLFQQVEAVGIDMPAGLPAVEELTAFAVQFRYALYEDDEGFDRLAGAGLAENFVAWAERLVETPVESGGAETQGSPPL